MEGLSEKDDRNKVPPYTGRNLEEEMRKKRFANDADASAGAAIRSKFEVSLPISSGFTAVNDSSRVAEISLPTPNSTDETHMHQLDVTLKMSGTWFREHHPVSQYLETRPRVLHPLAAQRKSRHPNKGVKRSADGRTTDEAVPAEAHVGASILDSSMNNPQLLTPQSSVKTPSPARRTKRKRTISAGMSVTKPSHYAYESQKSLKPQGDSGTSTKVANNLYADADLVSQDSLARLDVFRFKPTPPSRASGHDAGVDKEVRSTMLVQPDRAKLSSASNADSWTSNDNVDIKLDRPNSQVQPPKTPLQRTGSQFYGGHAAQRPSPVSTSPITASVTSSGWSVATQRVSMSHSLHHMGTCTLSGNVPRGEQRCGFQVSMTPDGPLWESKGGCHEEPSMKMMRQDAKCEDGVFSSEVDCYTARSPHSKTYKTPVVTAQGTRFGNNGDYIDYDHVILDNNERCLATNELTERSDETLAPAALRAQKEACEVFSLEEIDDGLDDDDLIEAVTQGCLEASSLHVRETYPAPDLDTQGDSEDYEALFGLFSSPNGIVQRRGADEFDDENWRVLVEEDHDLEGGLIDSTDAASSARTALTPCSGNRQVVKLAGPQPELAMLEHQGESSTYLTNDEMSAVDDDNGPKPIVRPPFPKQVGDRSPIMGLSAENCLRTCFRVGEALNVGCKAVRNNESVFLELYARVISSHREPEGVRQYFVFGDLFHDRPPHIHGSYEVWKGVGLWEYDSSRLLGEQARGRMCRCIGKMKKEKKEWKLLVLNIWEATWDDVRHVEGIVSA